MPDGSREFPCASNMTHQPSGRGHNFVARAARTHTPNHPLCDHLRVGRVKERGEVSVASGSRRADQPVTWTGLHSLARHQQYAHACSRQASPAIKQKALTITVTEGTKAALDPSAPTDISPHPLSRPCRTPLHQHVAKHPGSLGCCPCRTGTFPPPSPFPAPPSLLIPASPHAPVPMSGPPAAPTRIPPST